MKNSLFLQSEINPASSFQLWGKKTLGNNHCIFHTSLVESRLYLKMVFSVEMFENTAICVSSKKLPLFCLEMMVSQQPQLK